METVDFKKIERTPFEYLLLGGEVKELTQQEGFDASNMKVILQINGCDVVVGDFNKVLEGWAKRIREEVEEDQYVQKRAEQLIKERLGNIQDVLFEVENSLWKLDSE